jgi:hypothetical protein
MSNLKTLDTDDYIKNPFQKKLLVKNTKILFG